MASRTRPWITQIVGTRYPHRHQKPARAAFTAVRFAADGYPTVIIFEGLGRLVAEVRRADDGTLVYTMHPNTRIREIGEVQEALNVFGAMDSVEYLARTGANKAVPHTPDDGGGSN